MIQLCISTTPSTPKKRVAFFFSYNNSISSFLFPTITWNPLAGTVTWNPNVRNSLNKISAIRTVGILVSWPEAIFQSPLRLKQNLPGGPERVHRDLHVDRMGGDDPQLGTEHFSRTVFARWWWGWTSRPPPCIFHSLVQILPFEWHVPLGSSASGRF
jgi:hypothetical protein